jgi:hypothetical protein
MEYYSQKSFWKGLGDRAIATFAQALLAGLTAQGTGVIDWTGVLYLAGLTTLYSVLTSLAYPERATKKEDETKGVYKPGKSIIVPEIPKKD